ncbi:MAG: GPW/gp25 family protein [Bacteroidota bacterium]
MAKDKSFLGRGWSFPPTFHNYGDIGVAMVENEQDIQQSLEVLLTTGVGERIMLPEYGCNLQTYLFESISNSKMHFISEIIRSAIIDFEPRVILNDIKVDQTDYQEGVIKVKIDYTIVRTNTRFNLVFPYYKVEGTHLPQLYHQQITQNTIME